MQEGVLSLMQMAKTCSALATLNEQGGFSICVMTNPTTGGVTASFASVCDLTLAEPGALIGFAGPRVIASTIRQELPEGFQRSEFLISKGQLDIIVDRDELKDELASLIDYGTTRWEDYPPPLPEPAATSEAEGSASLEEGTPGGEEPGGEEPGDEEPGDEIPGPTQAEEKQVDLDSTEGVEREA
jgi:hypothetical protein